jgi:mRNA-degrading endonuclease RelE of RelBE toxin-antitoxin system
MKDDPFSGDVVRLEAQPTAWRRRVGSWRILFDVDPTNRTVDVADIERRTSTTY